MATTRPIYVHTFHDILRHDGVCNLFASIKSVPNQTLFAPFSSSLSNSFVSGPFPSSLTLSTDSRTIKSKARIRVKDRVWQINHLVSPFVVYTPIVRLSMDKTNKGNEVLHGMLSMLWIPRFLECMV